MQSTPLNTGLNKNSIGVCQSSTNFKHIVKQELNLYLHASSKIISFDLAQNLVTRCLHSAVEENKTQVNHMAQ